MSLTPALYEPHWEPSQVGRPSLRAPGQYPGASAVDSRRTRLVLRRPRRLAPPRGRRHQRGHRLRPAVNSAKPGRRPSGRGPGSLPQPTGPWPLKDASPRPPVASSSTEPITLAEAQARGFHADKDQRRVAHRQQAGYSEPNRGCRDDEPGRTPPSTGDPPKNQTQYGGVSRAGASSGPRDARLKPRPPTAAAQRRYGGRAARRHSPR